MDEIVVTKKLLISLKNLMSHIKILVLLYSIKDHFIIDYGLYIIFNTHLHTCFGFILVQPKTL